MLQKEVVERMAAGPGSTQYGRLSVMLQYRCEVIPLFNIGAGAFQPPPRVESAFVRLVPYREPPVAGCRGRQEKVRPPSGRETGLAEPGATRMRGDTAIPLRFNLFPSPAPSPLQGEGEKTWIFLRKYHRDQYPKSRHKETAYAPQEYCNTFVRPSCAGLSAAVPGVWR
jgi:hypothetical protein